MPPQTDASGIFVFRPAELSPDAIQKETVMNKEKANSLIEEAFKNPRAKLYHESILIPSKPVDLETVVRAAIETSDEEEDLDSEGHEAIFEQIGWPNDRIVAFYWQSWAPMVWECYLNSLRLPDGTELIWLYQDFEPFRQGIAVVRKPSNRAVMSAFFKALIEENGAMFGVELFGSLPSNTDNRREELIPENVVRAAYWKWLRWAEHRFDIDWHGIARTILARVEDPVLYPLKLLRGIAAGPGEDAGEWLDRHLDRYGSLSERAKRAIFNAYFKISYGPY